MISSETAEDFLHALRNGTDARLQPSTVIEDTTALGTNVAKALKTNPLLAMVHLDGAGLGPSQAALLASALRTNDSLLYLGLSENKIGPQGASDICAALKNNETLSYLFLGSNKIGPTGARALAKLMDVRKKLAVLDLSNNNIQAEGARDIALALKDNHVLAKLLLFENAIGPEGGRYVVEMLKENDTIDTLSLSSNELGNATVTRLAEALALNDTLTLLNVGGNGLDDGTATAFGRALSKNTTLKQLMLDANSIGDEGGYALLSAFHKNTFLTTLRLSWNDVGAPIVEQIEAECMKNEEYDRNPALRTEVGMLLKENGLEPLMPVFYREKVYTLEQAAELNRKCLQAFGMTFDQCRRLQALLHVHENTPAGKLLAANGFVKYTKQFYDQGVRDVEVLTKADLDYIGVADRRDSQALVQLFNKQPTNESVDTSLTALLGNFRNLPFQLKTAMCSRRM